MNGDDFLSLLGQIDEKYITEMYESYTELKQASSGKEGAAGKSMGSHSKTGRTGRTIFIAAVLTGLFTISAFAMGYSIHRQRQESLREKYRVEENNVQSYVEYETPEEGSEAPGITLLSAIRGGEFQYIFVNVSPVTEEEARACTRDYFFEFMFSTDGGESWSHSKPVYSLGEDASEHVISYYDDYYRETREMIDPDYLAEQIAAQAYDAETQTLTLELYIHRDRLEELNYEPVEITVISTINDGTETPSVNNYGSFVFTPTRQESRYFSFGSSFSTENPANGGRMNILGATVYPTGITWEYEHDDSDRCYYSQQSIENEIDMDVQLEWINFCGSALHGELIMKDGSSREVWDGESHEYRDGIIYTNFNWGETIDIMEIEGISLLGKTLKLE